MLPLSSWTVKPSWPIVAAVACTLPACTGTVEIPPLSKRLPSAYASTESSTIVITSDDKKLWVVNQDSDSISVVDTEHRALIAEISLTGSPPTVDPATGRYETRATPRALAIVDDARLVYVAAQTAGKVYVVDGLALKVVTSFPVCAEPTGIAAAPDGSAVYVVCHQSARVVKIRTADNAIVATLDVADKPWSVTVRSDGTLVVPHLTLEPGVSIIDASTFALRTRVLFSDEPKKSSKLLPSGSARALYGATLRPMTTGETWVPHLLLAIGTKQTPPDAPLLGLDFSSTVFPAITIIDVDDPNKEGRLLYRPGGIPEAAGAFSNVVSGPRQVGFTPDGNLALVAMGQSEDVLVFDAEKGTELQLVRPLPSAMLEGLVVSHRGDAAYVEGRNTHDITVLKIDQSNLSAPVTVDGPSINRLVDDSMPPDLRLGQRLFFTSNSARFPITTNFRVSCSSCHVERGSAGVTWRFGYGPRDVPSLAGGVAHTGFLMRQANLGSVQQYDKNILTLMGGHYDEFQPGETDDLDALAAFINLTVPYPTNPNLGEGGVLTERQELGRVLFDKTCAQCHYGLGLTDSGADNPNLDLNGVVLRHDIGTCVTTGAILDQESADYLGNSRTACEFDTPTLRGVFATAPYFHDGSAATLMDVIDRLPTSANLPNSEKEWLVEYVQSL